MLTVSVVEVNDERALGYILTESFMSDDVLSTSNRLACVVAQKCVFTNTLLKRHASLRVTCSYVMVHDCQPGNHKFFNCISEAGQKRTAKWNH